MEYVFTFDEHLKRPDETLDAYAGRKRLELGRELLSVKKIYLDTKFWLLLRDIELQRRSDEDLTALLGLLIRLVNEGLAICPISADTFVEVYKQTDSNTRRATIKLIDELSKGIGLLEPEERIKLELLHLVRENTRGPDSVHHRHELVWTKVGYVLGFMSPDFDELSEDLECAIQKAFLDQMWSISLADFVGNQGSDAPTLPLFKDVSDIQNREKLNHRNDYSSFKQLFLIELIGILELYKPLLSELIQYVYETDGIEPIGVESKSGEALASVIYGAFERNKIKTELPSFRILAALHAAVRWDLQRKYKHNDHHDFQHAAAALPYCDFFLTERSLRNLVHDRNLKFASFFRCQTYSDAPSALAALAELDKAR